MYGQNKSTLICPNCNKVSITFDPFLSLSVVVPTLELTTLSVFLVFANEKQSVVKVKVFIDSRSRIRKIREFFENSHKTKFLVYMLDRFLFKSICEDELLVENLKESSIFLYETRENIENFEVVAINISKSGEKGYIYSSQKSTISYARLLIVPKDSSTLSVANAIAELFSGIFHENSKVLPTTLEENTENSLYKINIVKKAKGLCKYCGLKCEGCLFPISETLPFSEVLSKSPSETFVLEIELSHKARLNDILNKYTEEKSINLSQKIKLDINYCIDLSSQPEKLDEKNKWYCSNCKDHVCATKQLKIYKLPEILIVHLLRFKKKGL
jgi:Ubiquitin C-terminal hydrolase